MAESRAKVAERILPSPHPIRIARPDQLKRSWLIIGGPEKRIQVRRHWNRERGVTEPCQCEPICHSGREDYFSPALQLMSGPNPEERLWEPVVLHTTETTIRGAYIKMRSGNDNGDLMGMLITLQRVGGGNGRVAISGSMRCPVSELWPRIDVGRVLLDRLGVSADFFGRRFDDLDVPALVEPRLDESPPINADQVVTPARSRSDKPRVGKGKK